MDDQTERMYELMRKESNRLKTFQMNPPWPKDYVDIKKLAKAGFFYAFNGDNVHCAFCRGQVCRWDRDDDPMSEHARHFTTCPFIMGGDVGNEPLDEDPIVGPKRPRPYDVCGMFPSFPPTDPRSRRELDFQEQPARLQQQQPIQQQPMRLQQRHQNQLNNTEQQPQKNPSPEVTTSSSIVTSTASTTTTTSGAAATTTTTEPTRETPPPESVGAATLPNESSVIQHNQLHQQQQPILVAKCNSSCNHTNCSHPAPATNSLSSNQANGGPPNNNLNGICKICYTNSIEMVFLPCGHSVSCLSCAQRLFTCPFCREIITTRIRTYLV